MIHRTYAGLGSRDAAVVEFTALTPWARELFALRAECEPLGPHYMAMNIPIDGLTTAAYHFTRRPDFYFAIAEEFTGRWPGNSRLADPAEARAAFVALQPYSRKLRLLMGRCRPFGRDYSALQIAHQGLETAAYHLTREAHFYRDSGAVPGQIR